MKWFKLVGKCPRVKPESNHIKVIPMILNIPLGNVEQKAVRL